MNQSAAPSLSAERRAAIVRLIDQNGKARVADLMKRFGVDASTIRRDLNALERQRAIERVHGGAIAVQKRPSLATVTPSSQADAVRIGQAVAELIADNETVFLGPGLLSLAVAKALGSGTHLTFITNSLEIGYWVAMNTDHTLIMTGGQITGYNLGLVGELARGVFANLRADKVILEVGGVSAVNGMTEDSLAQAEITRLLMKLGAEVIVLTAGERIERVAAVYVAPVSDADVVVTVRDAPSPFLWDLSESGVRVVLA
ncbi:MAG: DeoR/GlpR transcriptional regulator [Chloroflexi bacterium]|nr:DeoR/GlpR transcriptional regulator [Chloroflexota bacterium]